MDLLDRYKIISVATQGRQDSDQWVQSYKLACSTDGTTFHTVQGISTNPGADRVSLFSDYSFSNHFQCLPLVHIYMLGVLSTILNTQSISIQVLSRIEELSIFVNILEQECTSSNKSSIHIIFFPM